MSDDPIVTAPEPGESARADLAPPGAESRPVGRLSRMVPSWTRRRPALAGFGAGIVAAALLAGGVYEVQLPSGPPRGAYPGPPEQPCAMISSAELATFLPEATGTPESVAASGPVREGMCKWSSVSGTEARTLTAQVLVFSSPSSVSLARQAYHRFAAAWLSLPGRHPAPGHARLGDQAAEAFFSAGPGADFGSSPSASLPGTNLLVRSSNAVVALTLDTTATATAASWPASPGRDRPRPRRARPRRPSRTTPACATRAC